MKPPALFTVLSAQNVLLSLLALEDGVVPKMPRYAFLPPSVKPANPAIPITTPPINIQTALSVGEPVKNRETSELNEVVALMPRIVRTTPATRSAIAIGLFMAESLWSFNNVQKWVKPPVSVLCHTNAPTPHRGAVYAAVGPSANTRPAPKPSAALAAWRVLPLVVTLSTKLL
jgi:hypothetical protein